MSGMFTPRDEAQQKAYTEFTDELARQQVEEVRAARANATALLAGMRSGRWLNAQVFEPLRWMVPGIVPEGATILVGGPKVGKSWLAYGIALAVACGGEVLGALGVQQRPVLMLALEDGDRRLAARGSVLMNGEPLPDLFHYLTALGESAAIELIRAWLLLLPEDCPAPLVILDTYGRAVPQDGKEESSYLRDYRFATELKAVADARPGMALLVLHHDRKAVSDDFVQMVSGTNGIAGAFDTIMMLTRPRLASEGLLKITGRDVPENEYAVTSDGGPWTLAGESLSEAAKVAQTISEVAGLGEQSLAVLTFVNDFGSPVSPRQVADQLGMDRQLVQKYLTRLVDAGRIRKLGRGSYEGVGSVDTVDSGLLMPRTESTQSTEPTPPDPEVRHCRVCGGPTGAPGNVYCASCNDARITPMLEAAKADPGATTERAPR